MRFLIIDRMYSWKQNAFPVESHSIERVEINGKRHYQVDGRGHLTFPSVTTVLGCRGVAGLQEWRDRVGDDEADKISKKAAWHGTNLHHMCEETLNNRDHHSLDINDPIAEFMHRSMVHKLKFIDNIYFTEQFMFSKNIGVAGTVDCVADYDGLLSIIDFKSSRKPKKVEWINNYFAQATAYSIMFYEQYNVVPRQNVLLITNYDNYETQVFIDKSINHHEYLMESIHMFKNGETD